MAKRVFTVLVELEAENENDFVDTPFDVPGAFAQNLSAVLGDQMFNAGVLGTFRVSMSTVSAEAE